MEFTPGPEDAAPEPPCKHIRKGLEQGQLKKALLNVEWHVCQDCKADNKTQEKSEEETDESPSICQLDFVTLLVINIIGLWQKFSRTACLKALYDAEISPSLFGSQFGQLECVEPQLIKLDQPGPLTLAMYQFLTEMQETKKGVVTPKELFAQVCKKAIRFKGYQQQDSHELLRYLLDGMRAEEIQQISGGILKALTDSNKQNEEELKKKIKEYEKKKGMQSFVDRIFGGELTSTIMCEECRTKVKITNEKNVKKTKEKESEDEEDKNNDCYLKQKDEPPGTSKHLQKKAKKQAKKQAKSQRRQQKLQGKVLHLTDICATEESEKDVEYNQESEAEINSETPDTKQEVESSGCKDQCLTQKDPSIEGSSTEVQRMHENKGKPEQECVENESLRDIPMEGLDSPVTFVNGLDNLSLKDEDGENEDEEELATDFSKLHLGANAEADMSTLDDLQSVPVKTCEVLTEDPETAFCTLANREDLNPEEGSIYHCLSQFTRNEKLTETNKLLCDVCTQRHCGPKKNIKSEKYVYTNATKQMLISLAPPVLTLHLKRFQHAGFNLRKVNRHIKFPEVIDLAPFCTVKCKNVAEGNTKVLYSLYGVVEHSGTMRSGHYTAYAKVRSMNNQLSDLVVRGQSPQALETEPVKGQWFHISDTHVQAVSASKVLSSQAYLLFYERLL
ncbi:ubiquitin carboxyl-terminal hydrolase 16 isoform x2 [Limosa lapponica baueri]|uniref:Ubiquitin carboxyl-terminal hydrolase 16 isoform x2 n=1 Tax=Limosa lapponica baueri TaxID=1758121 RepID=A0A2I0U7V6_LIMLA|nr:ubiquitin carboxyl-terminal hydrolase 16 isoform x2 [Limosa lapponica baueri]